MIGRRIAVKSGKIYHVQWAPPKKEGFCDHSGEKLIQREDDKEEVVKSRLKVYFSELEPLIQYYKQQGLVTEIEASGSPTDVQRRLENDIGHKR